jgi:FAD/FMN-containing dehydrogenase
MNVVSSKLADVCERAAELLEKHGQLRRVAAHAATGQIHVLADETAGADLAAELRSLAVKAGGNCLFPRLPASLVGTIDPWGGVGPVGLMRGIKAALDPDRVFSPGRFSGRL